MFYRPEDGHGLPRNPLPAVVSPRPIGWISTRAASGDNLAPFSYFNAVSNEPPIVMFSGGPGADSVANALESGVYAVNIVERAAWEAMNATSALVDRGVDEFALAGIPRAECTTIDCPRVDGAPATLECRVIRDLVLPGGYTVVFGQVTGVHLRDDCLRDGRFDVTTYQPVARLGYLDYAFVEQVFPLKRPG